MKEIINTLNKKYWVKQHDSNTFSVICSYIEELKDIEASYSQLTLSNSANSAGGLTVWGEFKYSSL